MPPFALDLPSKMNEQTFKEGTKKSFSRILGHIEKNSSFSSQRASLQERIKKNFIFYFIEFDVFGTIINCFSVKVDPFCPLFS